MPFWVAIIVAGLVGSIVGSIGCYVIFVLYMSKAFRQ